MNTDHGAYDRTRRGRRRDDSAASGDALARWAPEDSPRTRRLLRLAGSSEGNHSEELRRRFFRPDPLVLYREGSWRLCPDGSLRRWDVARGRWDSLRPDEWSRDEATIVDDPDEPRLEAPAESVEAAPTDSSVDGCTFLGGTLEELCVYGKYTIVFGHEAITMLSRQAGVVEIPCSEVVAVGIGGRGRVTGRSLEGEGFAFQSAGGEVAATPVVKSMVTRSGMDTSIRIETTRGEAYFHCDCATPEEIRSPIAPLLARLQPARAQEPPQHADLSGRLAQLADLKARGLLTEDEFTVAIETVFGNEA